jgi:hypothetical protein
LDSKLYQILPFANESTLSRLLQRDENYYQMVNKAIGALKEENEVVNFPIIKKVTGIPENNIYMNEKISNFIRISM